jgi:hypothetical protein
LDFSQAVKTPTAFAFFEPGAKYSAKTLDNSNNINTRITIFANGMTLTL